MAQHRWMGLGSAAMTAEQAQQWEVVDGAVDESLALEMSRVVCVLCGEGFPAPTDACAPLEVGEVLQGHQWVSLMTMPLTDQEAKHWADPEDEFQLDIRPRSTNVVCVLCGEPYEGATEVCSEWRFWQLDDGS